jgi:hypothetical protein
MTGVTSNNYIFFVYQGITKKFSVDRKGGNTLPEFPNATEMILNDNLSVEKVQ